MAPSQGTSERDGFMWKYCRMCALELRQGVFIFGDEGKRLQIPEKIRKTVAILVLEEDSLPKKICTDCCSSLEDYSQYKDTVLDAQEKLTSIARNLEKSQEHSLLQLQINVTKSKSKQEMLTIHPSTRSGTVPVTKANTSPDVIPFSPEAGSPYSLQDSTPDEVDASSTITLTADVSHDLDIGDKSESTSAKEISVISDQGEISDTDCIRSTEAVKTLVATPPLPPVETTISQNVASTSISNGKSGHESSPDEERSLDWVLQCGICGIPVESREDLKRHHVKDHDVEKFNAPVYGCSLCPRISENYNALRLHIYRHMKEGTFKCTNCDRSFPLKDQLDRHWLSAHNPSGKAFSCKVCGKRFTAKCSLVSHMTSKHPLPPDEGETNQTKDQDDNHGESPFSPMAVEVDGLEEEAHESLTKGESSLSQKEPEPDNEIRGEQSPKPVSTSTSRVPDSESSELKKAETKADSGIWRCEYCDKIFQSLHGYQGHVATHKGKRFECEFCNASFTQKGSLGHHITSKHNESPKQFKCDLCSKEFVTSKLLQRHKRLHAEPRADSQCSVCGKMYKSLIHLKSHMKIHKLVKNFVCGTCGKSFPNQHKLSHHENIHTGARPFQCPHCSYAARSTGPFYRHVKAHKRDKEKDKTQSASTSLENVVQVQAPAPVVVANIPTSSSTPAPVLEDLSTKSPQKQQIQPNPLPTSTYGSPGDQLTSQQTHHPHLGSSQSQHNHNQGYPPQSDHSATHTSMGAHPTQPAHCESAHPHNSHENQSLAIHAQPQLQIWNSNGGSIGKSYSTNTSQSQSAAGLNNNIDLVDCAIHHTLTCEDLSQHQHHSQNPHPYQHHQQQQQSGHNFSPNQHQNQHQHSLIHSQSQNTQATFVPATSSTVTILGGGNGTSQNPHQHHHPHNQNQNNQSEPMELSYKLQIDNSGLQDMPMELTKVFQRDPLELCVRQGFNSLMDLSCRVNGSGNVGVADPNGMNLSSLSLSMSGGGNNNIHSGMNCVALSGYHKLDLTERELSFSDLSGTFRQPIDLISRVEDSSHEICSEGSLVDLSLRSSFVQDQSSFLRELIDLSARSDSFHGELNLTNKHNNPGTGSQSQIQHSQSHHHGHSGGSKHIGGGNGNQHQHQQHQGSLPSVMYQDAMFSL